MDQQDLELPIDIHYNKLLDWLIDRRHCDAKWLARLRPIRERVVASVQHLPLDEQLLAPFRKEQLPNYFHCRQILEILKTLDGDTKSLFGKFTSARVQEWAEIVGAYEKRRVYLAECAQQLIRNVNYEIPALKQAVLRCQHVQRDCTKREQEARTNAASLRAKFIASCKEMGIEGVLVRDELHQLLFELPLIFQQIVSILPTLMPALDFYQSFIQHSTGRPVQQPQFLPVLNYILKNGNVTLHQWKHGTEPECGQSSPGDTVEDSSKEEASEQIDWGDLELASDQESGAGPLASDQESGAGPPASDQESGAGLVVDWDGMDMSHIEVVEENGTAEEGGGTTEVGGEAADDPLDSLLSCSNTRSLFLDDVMELKEFVSWRAQEMSRDGGIGQFSIESDELRLHGVDSVEEMLSSVHCLLELVTNSRTQHLLLMKSSVRYLDRLAGSVLSHQLLSNKAIAQAEAMAARREESVNNALALQPQLTALIRATKELQKQLEQRISELYKNREVNIIGEINVM